jgi:FecR-like protein
MVRTRERRGPNRWRLVGWRVLTASLFLSLRAAVALEIGTVKGADGTIDIVRDKTLIPVAQDTMIDLGDELQTGKPGKADLYFFDRDVTAKPVGQKYAPIVSSLTLGDNSIAIIDKVEYSPQGARARFRLMEGSAYAHVDKTSARYEITTPTGFAVARGTEFLVKVDPGTEETKVLGASGTVQVTSLAGGEVPVGAREITVVAKGQPPTPPRRVTEEEFRQYIEGLEFIGGGRPESVSVGDPLKKGSKVPQPYRFALGVDPPPDTLEPCVHTSAPTCIPPEPVGGLGNLDIGF